MQHPYISSQLPTFIRKHYKILFHGTLVSIIYLFWIVFVHQSLQSVRAWVQILLYASTYVAIIYLNIYFVFDRFFLKGRWLGYMLISVISFGAGTYVLQGIYAPSLRAFYDAFVKIDFYIEMLLLFILYICFTGIGICYRLLKMYVEGERKISDLTNAGLKAELISLKNQVSPHFLFNTLNNLYVLTKTDMNKASETVLQLSDLMKYQLYETNHDKVPLAREAEYIRNILYIEELRKDKWTFNIKYPQTIPGYIQIEPLLFIALVENAIKHGTQRATKGILETSLQISDGIIFFMIRNSASPVKEPERHNKEHIGLPNLKRRLQLLYPERHKLNIISNSEFYCAELTLNL